MSTPPDDEDDRGSANLGGLVAVAVLLGLAVWLLVSFHHSSRTLDCESAGHADCDKYQ